MFDFSRKIDIIIFIPTLDLSFTIVYILFKDFLVIFFLCSKRMGDGVSSVA